MRELSILAFLVCVSTVVTVSAAQEPTRGYYRHPALHGDTIVFVAEGDLWTVGVDGGEARRLTTHPAEESHPAVSPDGEWLAFVGAYEGTPEVYVMPLAGGVPRRLTYEGETGRRRPRVAGWTPSGKVLAATAAYSTLPNVQLVALDPVSGDPRRVPLAQAAEGVYDPTGETLFFTRQAFQGSHTKRYRGGTAANLWKLSAGAGEAVPLTGDYAGTSKSPMWWRGRVYFASDRDGTMNLWSMDADGGDLVQHTSHDGWDVQEPAMDDGRVVYQLGADLRLYDVAADADREVAVTLASDFDQSRERWIDEPLDYLTAVHLSPSGDRVVLTARGEVFVAPVGDGRFVHVTRAPDVRYRQARFLPGDEGDALVALSDESGEVEWWRLPADGVGAAEQLSDDGKVLRYDGVPSPDGRWIVHHDHDTELWLLDVERGESWRIATSPSWGISGLPAWSPDSRWFAYSLYEENQMARIYLCEVEERAPFAVTSDRYHSRDPAWSPDGEWLYFLSDRHFRSLVWGPWGQRQPDPFFDRSTGIYALALRAGARFPFQPADELRPAPGDPEGTPKKEQENGAAVPRVEIDREGLAERLHEVPVPPGNYDELTAGERLLFLREATSFERERDLVALAVEPWAEPVALVEDVAGYELSLDGKKLLVTKGGRGRTQAVHVVDASAPAPIALGKPVDLSAWAFPLDPREEWRQMFVDAWRLHRDYFYDRGMHGVDWRVMLDKYRPLVDRVTSRAELSDLLAQMVGELSALHHYVRGGDHRPAPDDVDAAFLGAVLERDEAGGGYRVAHLRRTDPDLPGELAPLLRPGVGVTEGDVIVAINGVPTLETRPGASLRNQAGRQVRLRLRSGGESSGGESGGEERDVVVTPIDAGRAWDLRYDEWEYARRQRVEELGEGRIGYVHLRAMGAGNIAEWQRDFYPVFHRQGLIVDVRHNRGGNIDSWILGKLIRQAWTYWQARTGQPYWNMQQAFRGHLAVLVDEWTASDGELFAEGFRRLGLGPVIGTRTWGGEIWLTSSNDLVDRGIATAAEFGVYGPEGEWLIEGHGVEPDIVVDNLPHATFNGDDAQLRAAIDYLIEKIREDPRPVPEPPPYPDLSKPR